MLCVVAAQASPLHGEEDLQGSAAALTAQAQAPHHGQQVQNRPLQGRFVQRL